MTINETLTILI